MRGKQTTPATRATAALVPDAAVAPASTLSLCCGGLRQRGAGPEDVKAVKSLLKQIRSRSGAVRVLPEFHRDELLIHHDLTDMSRACRSGAHRWTRFGRYSEASGVSEVTVLGWRVLTCHVGGCCLCREVGAGGVVVQVEVQDGFLDLQSRPLCSCNLQPSVGACKAPAMLQWAAWRAASWLELELLGCVLALLLRALLLLACVLSCRRRRRALGAYGIWHARQTRLGRAGER